MCNLADIKDQKFKSHKITPKRKRSKDLKKVAKDLVKPQPEFPIKSNWPSDWRFKGWPPNENKSEDESLNGKFLNFYNTYFTLGYLLIYKKNDD